MRPVRTRRLHDSMDQHSPIASDARRRVAAGLAYGLAAYGVWGFAPLYFKALTSVAALEVLAHRVVWSLLLLVAWLLITGGAARVWPLLHQPRLLATLGFTSMLVASNWGVFIWAVGQNRVLESSLGYFINPLLNVLLGFLFLGERLRRAQWLSVLLAGGGVAFLTLRLGAVPWVALYLASAFAIYGLVRKLVPVDGVVGLTLETAALAPVALAYLAWLHTHGRLGFLHLGPGIDLLLITAGVVTALPLAWFANGVRRLQLGTMGFLQFISPTVQFLLAVLLYREPFGRTHVTTFAMIWAGVLLFSADAWRRRRSRIAPSA